MNIIFDEIVGSVQPDSPPEPVQETTSPAQRKERASAELRGRLCRLKEREARLRAD